MPNEDATPELPRTRHKHWDYLLQTLQAKNREAITNLQTVNTSLENTYIKYQLANFKSDEEVVQFFASQGVDQGLIQNLLVCKKTYEGNIGMITLLSYNNQALSETTGALTILEVTTSILKGIKKLRSLFIKAKK